jgi:sulfur-oxidizing protein SoxY
MTFTRRETLAVGGAALAVAALPAKLMASTADLIAGVTGGAAASSDGIELTAPEIAENGNTVPIAVSAPGAVAITLLAGGNPNTGRCNIQLWIWFSRAKRVNAYPSCGHTRRHCRC